MAKFNTRRCTHLVSSMSKVAKIETTSLLSRGTTFRKVRMSFATTYLSSGFYVGGPLELVFTVFHCFILDNWDQFEKYQSNLLGLPYDYDSIMHYGWNYFANDRSSPTIVPKKKASIGNRKLMSPGDVQKINILYECSGARAPSPSSGSSSGSPRPSSGSGSSSGRVSIWDLLLGGRRGSSDSSRSSFATDAPKSSVKSGLAGFFSGLFG